MLLLIPDCYRIPFALTEKTSSLIKSKFECGLQKPIKTYLLEKFQKFPFENFPLKTKRMRKSPLFNKYFEKKNFSNKSVQFSLRNGNSNFHFNILSIQNYIWENQIKVFRCCKLISWTTCIRMKIIKANSSIGNIIDLLTKHTHWTGNESLLKSFDVIEEKMFFYSFRFNVVLFVHKNQKSISLLHSFSIASFIPSTLCVELKNEWKKEIKNFRMTFW